MAPILGIMASQISGHLWAPSGAYDSIATANPSGTNTLTFSSIPQTYTHLQIRFIARDNRATNADYMNCYLNGDTASNYTNHYLYGNGSSALSSVDNPSSSVVLMRATGTNQTANAYGAGVLDILDYTNTSKYKTTRQLGGYEDNSTGLLYLVSALWRNTNAISSITITTGVGTSFDSYTQIALYGIKGN